MSEPMVIPDEPEYTEDGKRIIARWGDDVIVAADPAPLAVRILLADETGQSWAISVRPDGQLQAAKWPDGEARTMTMWANKAIVDALESAR